MNPEQLHQDVKDYYSQEVQQTSDLKFSACVCSSTKSPKHKEILSRISPIVIEKYYGCGTPIPEALEGATVLDLGCGTGRDVFVTAALAGKTGHVIGVDMTPEQLEVANGALEYHYGQFPESAKIEFKQGFIEDLQSIGVPDSSVDVVISNCVVNLSSNKLKVFQEIYRVLKEGGEVHISDIFSSKPLNEEACKNKMLVGECIGNVLDLTEFVDVMKKSGFDQIYPVEIRVIDVKHELIDPYTAFYSITFRAFKVSKNENTFENDVAKYVGGIDEYENAFKFDVMHEFRKNQSTPISTNVLEILQKSRFNKFFSFEKDENASYNQKEEFLDVLNEYLLNQATNCCCCNCNN
ncbi:methyltransferase domain-containing protein [Histomonas meleagridis]|uniref:methyltransferase domain-containing protein n=1 Tax=Histomonas meleagridis TaxID=135588 RepID=UPI00355A404F|nr:methyltransferase domain-containing protein [Histomonas meleagridis]KAH0804789.1 methyltransferase domain-containing protein [Histomonas meleagridis]